MRGQRPGRIVFYSRKVKSRGRKRGCGTITIAASQYFANPGGRLSAAANIDQRTDDIAHHVLEEGVGGKLEANQIAAAADLESAHRSDRRFRLAIGGAESAEIMVADQALRGLLHRPFIQAPVKPAYAPPKEPRALWPVEQPKNVAPFGGGKTRVELRAHCASPVHRNGIRQQCVAAPDPCPRRTLDINVEVHHLCERVHSGVGAPRAHSFDVLARHLRQRALQGVLHRTAVWLGLPAAERSAVVFESESNSHSGGSKAVAGRSKNAADQLTVELCSKAPPRDTAAVEWIVSGIEIGEHRLCGSLLLGVAFPKNFLEDLACTVLVTHFLVGLGKVELGLHVIPMIILARS